MYYIELKKIIIKREKLQHAWAIYCMASTLSVAFLHQEEHIELAVPGVKVE